MNKFLAIILAEGAPLDEQGFLEKLFPQPWEALATFVAFIVLLLVAFYFAYKPVKKLLKDRADYVENKIKNAEEQEEKAQHNLEASLEEIQNSKKEAIQIVQKAKEDALKVKEEIHKAAEQEKEAEILKAKEEIAREIEASKDEVHKEIVNVAILAAEKVLEREISEEDNDRLINDFINDVKEGKH